MGERGMCLDSFTSLDELGPRRRGSADAVLAALRRTGRFGSWEHPAIYETIARLNAVGAIRFVPESEGGSGYPWTTVEVLAPAPGAEGGNDG